MSTAGQRDREREIEVVREGRERDRQNKNEGEIETREVGRESKKGRARQTERDRERCSDTFQVIRISLVFFAGSSKKSKAQKYFSLLKTMVLKLKKSCTFTMVDCLMI